MPLNITVVDGVYSAVLGGEDIGAGVIAQRLKLLWGADGTGTVISAASPLPVVQTGPLVITTLPALPAGSNVIGAVTLSGPVVITTLPALPAGTNNIGDVDVLTLPALPTGANVIGAVTQSGVWSLRLQDGSGTAITNTAGALDVNVKTSSVGSTVVTEDGSIPSAATLVAQVIGTDYSYNEALATWTRDGGQTWFSYDVDETSEQVKATAGRIWGYNFSNLHATDGRWLRFYNHAGPTVGSTAALFPVYLPFKGTGHVWFGKDGPVFSTAISVAATTGTGPTNAGAPGTDEVMLTVWYK